MATKTKRTPKARQSAQIPLFTMVHDGTMTPARTETLQGLLALKPATHQWRGRDIVPPGSFLATVLEQFEDGCDVPLEIPAFTALHGVAAWLLDQNVTLSIQGSVNYPDLWSTILAESGASKTYTTSVLQRVMSLRRFPEVTTAAQFISDLQDHNHAAWFQDEWGQLIKRINNQTYADEIRDYLLRLYDNATLTRRTRGGIIEVENPALVVLGTTVTDTFLQNVTLESMLDGFMQRFQYIIADPRKDALMPLYTMEDDQHFTALQTAWATLQNLTIHPQYTASHAAMDAYCQHFRRMFHAHKTVPASFFRRVLWRSFKYGLVYHILLGKETAEIDAADMEWALRVAELHLHDARRLLDYYNMSDLEKIVLKAEALGQRLGHRPTRRELIAGVRDIKNAPMAQFILDLMTPPKTPKPSDIKGV